MQIKEKAFMAVLTTRGRKTGKEHSTILKAVNYNGMIYFSRHRPDSDWFKNAVADPKVEIQYSGMTLAGKAQLVTDVKLDETISMLKYQGEQRAKEKRVTIQVTLNDGN